MANINQNNFSLPQSPFAQGPQPVASVILDTIFAHLKDSDARMSAFIASQTQVNNDLSHKLTDLPELKQAVHANTNHIANLEQANVQLRQDVSALQSRLACQPTNLKAELVMSGFSVNLPDLPIVLAKKVLGALGLDALANHVLGAHVLTNKNVSSNTSPASTSLIVILTSNSVCDVIINAERAKRDLKVSDVLGTVAQGNIFVNQMLPIDLYNLLRQTKNRASQTRHKHVWVRNGIIHVRKDMGLPIIDILNTSDLEKLV